MTEVFGERVGCARVGCFRAVRVSSGSVPGRPSCQQRMQVESKLAQEALPREGLRNLVPRRLAPRALLRGGLAPGVIASEEALPPERSPCGAQRRSAAQSEVCGTPGEDALDAHQGLGVVQERAPSQPGA